MSGRYKMSTVCERTGFNQALLRAWERRHELLQPERTEGGHRLYTDEDLRVLARIRGLLESGHSIGEIASIGRAALLAEAPAPAVDAAPAEAVAGAALRSDVGAAAQVERLALAAARIDEPEVEAGLDAAFASLTPQAALERVVLPALVEVGVLWNAGRCTTAGEHLISAKVIGRLHALLRTANPASATARHAVCACLPDEDHEIGALACAYALARHGVRVTYLGARLPFEALEQTAEALRPNLVCLSAARPSVLQAHRRRLIETARRLPPGVRMLLGGGGVQSADEELDASGVVLVHPGGPRLLELIA